MDLLKGILGSKEPNLIGTFEVERKQKEEDFSLETLKLFHAECQGGIAKIKVVNQSGDFKILSIICARCGFQVQADSNHNIRQRIVLLALDPAHEFNLSVGLISSDAITFKAQSS